MAAKRRPSRYMPEELRKAKQVKIRLFPHERLQLEALAGRMEMTLSQTVVALVHRAHSRATDTSCVHSEKGNGE